MGKQGPEAESRSLVGEEGMVRGVSRKEGLGLAVGPELSLAGVPSGHRVCLSSAPQILAEQISGCPTFAMASEPQNHYYLGQAQSKDIILNHDYHFTNHSHHCGTLSTYHVPGRVLRLYDCSCFRDEDTKNQR